VGLASDSTKPPKRVHTKRWWLLYGTLAWGIPFFVVMTVFWGFVLVVVIILLQRRLNWRFYIDPQIHAVGLLAFTFVISLLGGCYWGFRMWKFFDQNAMRPQHTSAQVKRGPINRCQRLHRLSGGLRQVLRLLRRLSRPRKNSVKSGCKPAVLYAQRKAPEYAAQDEPASGENEQY